MYGCMETNQSVKARIYTLRCILKNLEGVLKTTPSEEVKKLVMKDMQEKAFLLQQAIQEATA